jgi:hypothetical protein
MGRVTPHHPLRGSFSSRRSLGYHDPKDLYTSRGCGYRSLLLEEKVSAKPTDEVAP